MACVSRATDGVAPLRRPRVDAWALAATSAPSLLALNFGYRSPSASGAKQHRGRRFLPSATRGAGLSAVRGWLGPKRPGASSRSHLPVLDRYAYVHVTPTRGAAVALNGRRTASQGRIRIGCSGGVRRCSRTTIELIAGGRAKDAALRRPPKPTLRHIQPLPDASHSSNPRLD